MTDKSMRDQVADEQVLRWTTTMNDEAVRIMSTAIAEVPESDKADAVAGFARIVLEESPTNNKLEKLATLYADAIYRLMLAEGRSNG